MRSGSAETEKPKPAADPHAQSCRPWLGPVTVALLATVAALVTLAPESGGPGITCDEPYQVAYGKGLVWSLRQQGWSFFSPANIARNFRWGRHGPPVHPPLGNWILGVIHGLFDVAPDELGVVSLVAARFAPALAFGLLVLIVGLWTAKVEGGKAGTAAAAAVFLTPRLFGHAHLAALDMLTTLFFTMAALAVIVAHARGGRWWQYALAGIVWGLAMLVRLHGVLLAAPVVVWLVWRLRRRVLGPLLAWGIAGVATLYAGWPWLWLAPFANLKQYLATGTQRQALQVFYLGRVWADHDVPRHYAVATFAVVLPLGFLILGILGLWARRRLRRAPPGTGLLAALLAFVLAVFSFPGTPVYDGERLFLMAFPLWAVFVGIGAKWLVEHPGLPSWGRRARTVSVGALIALQGLGLVLYHPCYLSHYSLLVGGLAGAERLGFEVDYWGGGITESLLSQAADNAAGQRLLFGPNLAPYQVPGIQIASPSLIEREVKLVGWDASRPQEALGCRYGLFYHRKANLASVPEALRQGRVVGQVARQGVWIAQVVEFAEPVSAKTLSQLIEAPAIAPP
ncbi:MAG: glycosyltransferase family 39 protein [Thermoguttaceae bacterium]|nr:glycosyltransferase family 39 protein [Thermoguttaceae bacterium]